MSYTDQHIKDAIEEGYDTVPMMVKHFMGIESAYIRNVDFATYKRYRQVAGSLRRRLYSLERNKVVEKVAIINKDGHYTAQYRWAI